MRNSVRGLARLGVLLALVFVIAVVPGCGKKNPDNKLANADVHYKAGMNYLMKGDLIRARQEFESAIGLRADIADYHDALGLTHLNLGNFEIAEKRMKEAIGISSGIPRFHNNLANVYLAMKRYDETIEAAEIALKYPNNVSPETALYLIGMAHLGKGDQIAATEAFQKSIDKNPEFPKPYVQLAAQELERRECDSAFKHIRTAMTLVNQKEPNSLLLYGKVMLTCFDDKVKAMDSLLSIIDIAPDSPQATEARALLKTFRDKP